MSDSTPRLLGVVPARMAATRFPGKPLVEFGGRPMIAWVHDAAKAAGVFDEVVVATPDEEIAEVVRAFGGIVELTRDDHPTGTDRVAEVAERRDGFDVVANVQGDQPFVTKAMLASLVAPYVNGERPPMTTLGAPIDVDAAATDPNTVKVLVDRNGDALYFSRAPIPYQRTPAGAAGLPVRHHLGLYAFTREFLLGYSKLTPTPLEACEGLEQLRVLEHGYRIRVCDTDESVIEVNTPEDFALAQARVEG